MRKFLFILLMCFVFPAYADVASRNPIIQDEGVAVAGGGRILNFTGAGVAVTFAGGKYVITIGGGGSGDAVTVNSSAADTTANIKDSTDITWTLVDGGAGGPDDVQGAVVDDSHNHVIANIDAFTSAALYGQVSDETGSASGTPLAVFNVNPTLTGATLAGILADNDDMIFECDANNDGSSKYSFTDGAGAEIASITEAGLLTANGNMAIKNGTADDAEFKLYEDGDDGTNYTSFLAQAFTSNYTWILPNETGSAGQVLEIASVDGSTMTLEWDSDDTAAGGAPPLADVLAAGADANDLDITSLDKLEGVDAQVYIDLGTDSFIELEADGGVQFGSAGVQFLDDADGAITLKGLGDGSDEDLNINLDDTADTAVISSSTGVGTVDFGTINLETDVFEADTDVQTGADPADQGALRLSNAEIIAWEDATECTLTHVDNTGLLLNLELEVDGTLDADGVVELGDGGDTFALSSTGIDIDTSGNITNGGTVGCGAITSTAGIALAGIISDNDDMVFECDANSDGSNKYSFTDGASAEVVSITETGVINSQALTASEIVITDASKNIASAAVATYPSLTELTYVKGVTSAIQTQLGGKQATVTEGSLADSTVVSADIKNGEIVVADTAITAGRSLTWSTNDLVADAELYTDTKCFYFEDPTADDDFKSIWRPKGYAATVTSIWAESDQTVTFMLQVDDGSAADMDSVDLAPAAGVAEDTSLDGDATVADGDRVDLAVTSVANTPTW